MELIKSVIKIKGVDIGYHDSVIDPVDREGCVGKHGINKSYSFEEVLKIASKINIKPNIIIKAGKNAKWYLKSCPKHMINENIQKQKWRPGTSRYMMYVIEWDLNRNE